MSFRLRLTMLVALAATAVIVATSSLVYFTDRRQLIGQVDGELSSARALPGLRIVQFPPPPGARVSRTVVEGKVAVGTRRIVLPRLLKAIQVNVVADNLKTPLPGRARFTTASVAGVPSRVLTYSLSDRTVRLSASLVEVDGNLSHLRSLLLLISLGGIGAATLLAAALSGRAVAPLRRLTETTERIVETGDLSERTRHHGRDEVGRLSARLDELLATLEASLRSQRQLVADASHELRTPLATLRANVELLADPRALEQRQRAELVSDVRDELEAMTTLVGELVELARGEERDVAPSEYRLDEVVRAAVERAARRSPAVAFRTRLEPALVTGVPERVERAVANLLDNARKWSPSGEIVDVSVQEGLVEVRDRGPGIAAADRPLVFDRFYRSAKARGMPGAGLGLAIVKQIADAHGGSVSVDEAPGGGAILRLRVSSPRVVDAPSAPAAAGALPAPGGLRG